MREFTARIFKAWKDLEVRESRAIPQAEIGQRVGAILHRAAFAQAVVSRWFRGRRPNYLVMEALADVFGVRKGWLAFGEGEPWDPAPWPSPMKVVGKGSARGSGPRDLAKNLGSPR